MSSIEELELAGYNPMLQPDRDVYELTTISGPKWVSRELVMRATLDFIMLIAGPPARSHRSLT